jgi:hypothetical protein
VRENLEVSDRQVQQATRVSENALTTRSLAQIAAELQREKQTLEEKDRLEMEELRLAREARAQPPGRVSTIQTVVSHDATDNLDLEKGESGTNLPSLNASPLPGPSRSRS